MPKKPAPTAPPDPAAFELHASFLAALRGAWRAAARPEQVAPEGDWTTWVFCGGRGAGKTRSGAEWVLERVQGGARFVHLIAPTAADVRDVMLEGPAGILTIASQALRPTYQPSLRKLVWPNGAQGLLFSGDEPERLRGPQADTIWMDELCAMRQGQEVLDNAMFGLRVGQDPRCLITTTPRPLKFFRQLLARDGQDVRVTRSSSYANRENLALSFFGSIVAKYAGTRLGRQELDAELLTDTPGALWAMERIEELRVRTAPQPLERVVVAIDPATTFGPEADETGIVVVALGRDGDGYLLDDLSGRYPPEEWARKAIAAYRAHAADRMIGEVNNGGALIEHTLRSVDASIPFTAVHASRGKLTRAEPISALYEQGRVHHVGAFGPLEDQLTSYDGSRSGASPDRLDALVWGLTAVMLEAPPGTFIRTDAMLRPSAGGELAGVEVPNRNVSEVFAFAAATEQQPAAVGVVYVAIVGEAAESRAVILDWDLWEFEASRLDALYGAVAARLAELRLECGLERGQSELTVDPVATGLILIDEGGDRRDLDVRALDSEALLKRSPVERATECGVQLGKRRVKIARGAYEKATTFKGVQRNHLLAQMRAFKLDTAEQASVAPLLAAAAGAVCDALRADREMDMWRRLGKSSAPEEAQRLIDSNGRMIIEEPQRRIVSLSQHSREQLTADQKAREAAAARQRTENEVRLETQNARERAALVERERRMRAEEDSA